MELSRNKIHNDYRPIGERLFSAAAILGRMSWNYGANIQLGGEVKDFLERAAQDSKLSYRDLHILLDALPTPISWASLPDGRIQFANRAFKKTFGYSETEFATVEDWVQKAYVLEADRRKAHERWEVLWQAQQQGISEIAPFEIQVRCADGSTRTVQHRGVVLHDIGIGVASFEDISERKLMEESLHRIAFEDPLTGLPNRRAMQARWTDAMNKDQMPSSAALLLIDLDGFKSVNDRFGHDAGDEVLIATAGRLKESIRSGDFICRLGGDEFVVLLSELDSTVVVEQICWRIGAALTSTLEVNGKTADVGASIGVSLYPQDGEELQVLLKSADEAMYRIKASHKGGWEWFKSPVAA